MPKAAPLLATVKNPSKGASRCAARFAVEQGLLPALSRDRPAWNENRTSQGSSRRAAPREILADRQSFAYCVLTQFIGRQEVPYVSLFHCGVSRARADSSRLRPEASAVPR